MWVPFNNFASTGHLDKPGSMQQKKKKKKLLFFQYRDLYDAKGKHPWVHHRQSEILHMQLFSCTCSVPCHLPLRPLDLDLRGETNCPQ